MTIINGCLTCGTGRRWWFHYEGKPPKCPICEGNPLIKGDGRPDHADHHRARMVRMFGPRMEGDEELLAKYFPEEVPT